MHCQILRSLSLFFLISSLVRFLCDFDDLGGNQRWWSFLFRTFHRPRNCITYSIPATWVSVAFYLSGFFLRLPIQFLISNLIVLHWSSYSFCAEVFWALGENFWRPVVLFLFCPSVPSCPFPRRPSVFLEARLCSLSDGTGKSDNRFFSSCCTLLPSTCLLLLIILINWHCMIPLRIEEWFQINIWFIIYKWKACIQVKFNSQLRWAPIWIQLFNLHVFSWTGH